MMPASKFFFIVVIAACSLGTYFFRDNPSIENMSKYSKLAEWVSVQDEKAIFAVPFGPLTQLFPIFYKRGLYAGHAFPFNEDSMVEFCVRDQYLYGSESERVAFRGPWIGQSMSNVYRSRRQENFIYFSEQYQLDFVVLEHEFIDNFQPSLSTIFSGDGYDVYSVKEMKAKGIKGYSPANPDTMCTKSRAQ
jgi:hypothetical protein